MHISSGANRRGLAISGMTALLTLVAGPALASSQTGATTVTGPESISGTLHGAPALTSGNLPVIFRGVVTTQGSVNLNGSKSKTHTVASKAGNLVVEATGYKHTTQTQNTKTCRFTFTQNLTFTVLGGKSTGAFAGASGPGAAKIFFAAYEPRFTSGKNKGECNGNAQPLAKGAVASFLASVVLTVRR